MERAQGGSEVKRGLASRILFPRGTLERVTAPGGQLNRPFAQAHRLLNGDDLETRDGGKAGFFVQARTGGFGDHRLGRLGQGKEDADPGLFAFA